MNFLIRTDGLEKSIKALNADPTDADRLNLVEAVEIGVIGGGNYRQSFVALQNTWKPLTPAYIKRKEKAGLGNKKWSLRGDSFKALTTVIPIKGRTANNEFGRTMKVTDMPRRLYRVTFQWRMGSPSATGWPKRRSKRSYFAKNDRVRPWISVITETSEEKALSLMVGHVYEWLEKRFKA